MRFSATTLYDRERLLSFNKFVAFEKKWFWIILSACTLVCLGAFVFLLASGSMDKTATICAAIMVLVDIFYVLTSFVLPIRAIKKSPTLNSKITFEFNNDCFSVKANTKNGNAVAEHRYSVITKARENKNDIYLYIAKQQAYIVDKSTIQLGTEEEFKQFLKCRNIIIK